MRFSSSNFLRSRRGVAAVAALVLILFLFRPGVYRLRNRISNTIGSALGRRVSIDSVHFHLLPRPGFALEGLVVYDDPEFSAEPMIRAQEVSAAIRVRSLLRGRLEIATLSATDPSINLVRSDNGRSDNGRSNEGRWNLASLVERNAQIPAAPTGKPASERRPAFPYLEATGARINFKLGQTKKSYALMDADVALWQDSENSWAARIQAAPVRTDFNLSDTGLVQINATWQRASSLRSTPVRIAAQWKNGQLGQITTLLSGRDRGWRGGLTFTANLSGTPEALRIESQAAIDGFRRYDIARSENVRLVTVCSGEYNTVTSTLADLLCESPVSGGTVRLRGNLDVVAPAPTYDLTLEADKVPLASVVRLLRQAKKQIPADLTATGSLNAEFRATRGFPADRRRGFTTRWTGNGSATNVRLSSNVANEVALGTVPLALTDSPGDQIRRPRTQDKEQEPAEPHLRIGPVALTMNTSAPIDAGGWVSAAGYRFFLRGDMELQDLFRLENDLGLPVARPAAEGAAKLDVNVSGPWQGFAPLTTLGTAQLRNVRVEMRGLNTPIEIGSATMSLAPDAVSVDKISARLGSTHWSGAVTVPRPCAVPACVFQFDLMADQLSTGDLAEWFTPHPAKRPWYRILNPNSNSDDARSLSPLLALQAHGNLQVGRFGLKKVVATQVATQVDVDRGKITLTDLRGQLLQGTHQGTWTIDVSAQDVSARDASSQSVRYRGAGTLHDISLAQVSALTLTLTLTLTSTSTSTNDAWITGTADGKFDLEGSADGFRDLLARSDGKLQFVMRNGSLPRIKIPGSPAPLPVYRFSGDLHLKEGAWELSAGRLESRDSFYRVQGTASPANGFDFVLTRGDERTWNLTGTLAKPRVAPAYPSEVKRAEADAKTVKP